MMKNQQARQQFDCELIGKLYWIAVPQYVTMTLLSVDREFNKIILSNCKEEHP